MTARPIQIWIRVTEQFDQWAQSQADAAGLTKATWLWMKLVEMQRGMEEK